MSTDAFRHAAVGSIAGLCIAALIGLHVIGAAIGRALNAGDA